jgi:hypothetical protein
MNRLLVLCVSLAGVVACEDDIVVDGLPPAPPSNLFYDLEPSGDPLAPAGLVLRWAPSPANNLAVYRVYSRPGTAGGYDLRGETTSTTFHDTGIPDGSYAVSAVDLDGFESSLIEVVIDERLRLESPNSLVSTSLNGAIHLLWSDNAFLSEPEGFKQYRVYSTLYSLDDNLCEDGWALEGTTVSPEFLAAALTNGVPRCFAVAAESIEGWESVWSPRRADTPRPDARNILLFADAVDPSAAGFRFHQDLDGDGQVDQNELGLIRPSTSPTVDFWIDRDPVTLELIITPERAGTSVALYGNDPVADLTSIDIAPETGFSPVPITVAPGFGYVFQMDGGDGFARFGAFRATHVGTDFVIFDWSYQTDPGNPELQVRGGFGSAEPELIVRRR